MSEFIDFLKKRDYTASCPFLAVHQTSWLQVDLCTLSHHTSDVRLLWFIRIFGTFSKIHTQSFNLTSRTVTGKYYLTEHSIAFFCFEFICLWSLLLMRCATDSCVLTMPFCSSPCCPLTQRLAQQPRQYWKLNGTIFRRTQLGISVRSNSLLVDCLIAFLTNKWFMLVVLPII